MTERNLVTPHEWDDWARNYKETKARTLTATNGLGEAMCVDLIQSSSSDWDESKYFTSNCSNCPLFIPGDQVDGIVATLRQQSRLHFLEIPSHTAGVCIFSRTRREGSFFQTIHKFLIQETGRSLKACNLKGDRRLQRAEGKRNIGEIIRPASADHVAD